MFLANIELANPILFTVQNSFVTYQNVVADGVIVTKLLRYPVSGSPYVQKRSLIRMNFGDIAPSDFPAYENAFHLATDSYVFLSLTGLNLTLQLDADHGLVDTAWVTVAPGTTLQAEIQPGFTKSEMTGLMEGPYLYTFTISLVTGDLFYSNGN